MRGKILILTGLAVGYVLGARAGRQRYEKIKSAASKFWNDPRVQEQVERVEDFAKDKAPDVVDFISDNAKKVVSKTTKKAQAAKTGQGSKTSGSKSSGSKSSSGSSASKTPASGSSKSTGGSGSSIGARTNSK